MIAVLLLALATPPAADDAEACRVAATSVGKRATAIEVCERVATHDPSANNLTLLAVALLKEDPQRPPTPQDIRRAQHLAEEAARLAPEARVPQRILCELALRNNNSDLLRGCSQALLRIEYMSPRTQYYAAVLALLEKRWDDAERDLERARSMGLGQLEGDLLARAIAQQRPLGLEWLGTGSWGLAFWLGGMLLLFCFGSILSALALRVARRIPARQTGRAQGASAVLRATYRTVMWLCCAYYYLSIPVLLAVVIGAGGGAIYMFFAMGRVPIGIVVVIVTLSLATLAAMVRSAFVPGRDSDPGLRLEGERQLRLRAVLDGVAGRIGTRAVDEVYVKPGTEIAVAERGGVLRQMGRANRRCLILGIAVLEGMTVGEFKAALAHEYGHFSNQDTAGGSFALAVRRSMLMLMLSLVEGRVAVWYNPVCWFVQAFERVFLRVSLGASRLQEVLADRWAAFAYGSAAFERSLRHAIARAIVFDAHMRATLDEVIAQKRGLANLYAYRPAKPNGPPDLEKAVDASLTLPPGPFDSHPGGGDRIAWVRALAASPAEPSPDDSAEVWSLIDGREELEKQMTCRVRQSVLQTRGISIPDLSPSTPAQSDSAAPRQTTST